MTDPFDWQVGEEDDEAVLPIEQLEGDPSGRFWLRSVGVLLGTAVILLFIFSSYRTGEKQLEKIEISIRERVQSQLDLQVKAMRTGDGELFFTFHEDNSIWRAAQLLPENQAFYKAKPQITRLETNDTIIWANTVATIDGQPTNRILFFQEQPTGLQQIATDPTFWGAATRFPTDWGSLQLQKTDEGWVEAFDEFVADLIRQQCAASCLDQKTVFHLQVGTGYDETAVATQINIPSPRLIGLDDTGQPTEAYWALLEQRIIAHITPATIRFGVPTDTFSFSSYQFAAEQFMAEHPDIIVELVPLDSPDPALADVSGLDGATLFPTESMLAEGRVRNLTDFLLTDPDFDYTDFYEQIWQGAWWEHQFWLVPQAGQMRLLYYDRTAYQQIGQPEPTLRWSWEDLEEDMDQFANSNIHPEWGFLDTGNDALYSYAYNWLNNCEAQNGDPCSDTLTPEALAAAYQWYAGHSGQSGHIPDMTRIKLSLPASRYDVETRVVLHSNWQSVYRRAVVWVEDLDRFELMVQLNPLGIVPFPGSDRFDGITPVWIHGHIVFQETERPLAAWQWISYLSKQNVSSRFRYVPARASVATESRYWQTLPRQLSDPIQTAIPFARPILIEEQHYFSWDEITAVSSGERTPQQASQINHTPNWFGERE